MRAFHAYLARLPPGRQVLWCYLVWYLVMTTLHFDPSPRLWLTAMGISAIMGFALFLSFGIPGQRPDRWHVMRLFLLPFCVASFSALIKGQGFVLVFSPDVGENGLALGLCGLFVLACAIARRTVPRAH
jgi:asparagine N-glycosylation enzyme membrane subunit Stt3